MSYKTILLILFCIFFRNQLSAQESRVEEYAQLHQKILQLVDFAIAKRAFPGCTVYASKGDSVIYLESFGYHTYDSIQPVLPTDIYDLASVTKIAAATLALMKLFEMGLFDLDDPINMYIQGLRWSKVGKATFREILAHEAGFESWIKYYDRIKRKKGGYKRHTISDHYSERYSFKLSEGMYLHQNFADQIKRFIRKTKVTKGQGYLYSGLFFYLVPELVQNLSGLNFEEFLDLHFYEPLGAETIVFNPLNNFDQSRIIPTELDTFFRYEQIHGMVHDEGAILMKGVSGNAGLFSNAEDLARIGHVWIGAGNRENKLLKSTTIDLFATCQYPNHDNRRGLGFDKPLLEYDSLRSSVSQHASKESFGHSGYTGTFLWIDPETDLTFIFLSNRVYPTRANTEIYKMHIRPGIHALFYEYLR